MGLAKPQFENLEILKTREVGSHSVSLSRYRDKGNDMEFFGVTADCVIQATGNQREAESYMRRLCTALKKGAEERAAKTKDKPEKQKGKTGNGNGKMRDEE